MSRVGGEADGMDKEVAEMHLAYCFAIAESGETSKVAGHQKLIHYKSPIPKTKLTRALLTDNICDERKLQVQLDKLRSQRKKESARLRQRKTAFAHSQELKKKIWSKADEQCINRLNLPQIQSGNKLLKSASVNQIYKKPQNDKTAVFSVPLLPVMVGDDDHKIIEYDRQIFLTRLPNITRLETRQLKRYNGYKGARLMEGNKVIQDRRFQGLSDALSERKSASEPKRKTALPFFLTRSLTHL